MPVPPAMLEVIGSIYDAALNPELWSSVLRQVGELLGGTMVGISLVRGEKSSFVGYGISTDVARDYEAHYRYVDPVRLHLDRSPIGIYSSRQIVPKSNLRFEEIFGDFGRMNGLAYCMQGYLFREDRCSALIGTCRTAEMDEFEPAEVEMLAKLAPHLERALKVQIASTAAQEQANIMATALDRWPTAVFAIGAGGRVVFANESAELLLTEIDGLLVREGRLQTKTDTQTQQFDGMLKRALGGEDAACESGSMLLERAPGRRPLSIQVLPCSAANAGILGMGTRALVFVSNPEKADQAGQRRLQELYKLTRSEAALAHIVSTGIGVKAAARTLGIAPSTARTHLRRTFEKTGAGRQAELANLVGLSRLSGE